MTEPLIGRDSWWGLDAIAAAPASAVWAEGSEAITYARLREEVDAVRVRSRAAGARKGCTVALRVSPSFTFLWWLFGLWADGIRVLLLDARMKDAEADAVMEQVAPHFIVTGEPPTDPLTAFHDRYEVTLEQHVAVGTAEDDELALIQCSSGSSGVPKIVGRTAAALLADVDRNVANPGMPKRGERVYLLSPATHAFGLMAGVLTALRAGATLVLPDRLHPEDLALRACLADVAAILGAPVHFDLLGRASGDHRPPSLRLAVSCGDALPPSVRDRFAEKYGVTVGQVYGMTEVGVIATDLTGSCAPPAVGRTLPGVEVRIVDGELFVRSDRCPYIGPDQEGRYADGWLRTFDRAEFEPGSGALRVLGRADSVRNIGGLKVDLSEIEQVLRGHPEVIDALVTCGAPEAADGPQVPMIEAYIATTGTPTPEELSEWCHRRLSDFKVPRRWHVDTDIPRNAAGKADRRNLTRSTG
ncbi:class I adenylate-forming enzyme family protein [Lentzea sp. NPDC004782]|uniref:class I adenylate-forming enzyme family protein n=1 Tax=Lentzea sp. NPDC004782 TaxID=3154458 RepID=UPI0033A74AE3